MGDDGSSPAPDLASDPGGAASPSACTPVEASGNPVFAGTGNKYQRELDYEGPHGLRLVRHYNSALPGWVHNWGVRIFANATAARVVRPDGRSHLFTGSGAGVWTAESHVRDQLTRLSPADESQPTWKYAVNTDASEYYDNKGRLLRLERRNGHAYTAQYTGGQLVRIVGPFGQSLQFGYDSNGRLATVTTPEGAAITYGYDTQGRLAQVTYPGATTRQYLYENSTYRLALTGIIDESGTRYATWSYDEQGRAISSEHSGGVQRFNLAYGTNGSVSITDPLGASRTQQYASVGGRKLFTGQTLPCANCIGDAANKQLDPATGLMTQTTDYLGIATLFTWDTSRKLPTAITRAAGRPEHKSVEVEWHPIYRLPVRVNEEGRSTVYAYDQQGNKVGQAITDTATGQARTWGWTYNAQGIAQTMTDPRGGVWQYSYDGLGNLTSFINPLGQATTYTHDAAGRVLTEVAPGGLLTNYTYDARGRLTSATTGGETTSYAYAPTGQLASATLPNGYHVSYLYDAAQRLLGVQDNRGASIAYTLDTAGNRLREEVKDAGGNIALVTSRIINSLNKVAAVQGSLGQTTQFGYDANGAPISATDPLNQTTRQTLDGLRRTTAVTFADNSSATQAWNQLDQLTHVADPKGVATQFTYNAFGEVVTETSPDIGTIRYMRDAAGNVTQIQDAKGQIGTIERDALGRITRIQYAADHQAFFTYDAAGYVTKIEDKSGSTKYERDLHGRITAKIQSVNDNPNNPSTFELHYTYANGELTGITYPSGLKVNYQRSAGRITGIDVQGRGKSVVPFVSNLTHTALGQPKGWSWSTGDSASRTFDTDGRMTANEFASYVYDPAGRITSITQQLLATRSGSEQFRAPITWTAAYDSRNRLISLARDGAQTKYTYDNNSNRLTAVDKISGATDLDFALDGENRSQIIDQTLNVDAGSNKLLGFKQTTTTLQNDTTKTVVTTPVTYSLDANGAITSDGLRTFNYDESGRLATVRIFQSGEAMTVSYLHNALGQRVFKSEQEAERTLPSEEELGKDFIGWLKDRFGWLFAPHHNGKTSLGQAFVYGEGDLPSWALVGEYDNGSASGRGVGEYIWLPTADGGAVPVGLYRGGKIYAIHADHLGTPRLITDKDNKPVWQWPYSAFGNNEPIGWLAGSSANRPSVLKPTKPLIEVNLRLPGQYFDEETKLAYNLNRSYMPGQGRYTQPDPIGLAGSLNRFSYVSANPISFIDPTGLLCVYSQSTGRMTCTNSQGLTYYDQQGYAGTGSGRNNPAAQGESSVGPLPRGDWQVTGDWYSSPNTGRNTIRLAPLPGNDCAGTGRDCSSFRMHGNNSRNDASHGCIVLPPNRTIIPSGEIVRVTE